MHALPLLDYLPKLKRSLEQAFGAHFLHTFSIKISLFDTLSIDQVSLSDILSFSKYQAKCEVLIYPIDDL